MDELLIAGMSGLLLIVGMSALLLLVGAALGSHLERRYWIRLLVAAPRKEAP